MKILVTGASGLLGHKVAEAALSRGYEVYSTYKSNPIHIGNPIKLDFSSLSDLPRKISEVSPEVIVNCAAYTSVDGCEVNREYAWIVNVEAVRLIAKYCVERKTYLIHVSTDYVFDGERGNYLEEDLPNPLNYYGLTKLLGEEAIKSIEPKYCIVRSSAIYGSGIGKKNFAVLVVEKLSKGEELKALIDQFVSPTLNTLLAESILELIEKDFTGVIHIAGEKTSRYEFAVKLAKEFNLPLELIVKAEMKDLNWVAKRPRDSSLNTSKARKVLKTNFYDINSSIRRFREEFGELHASRS